MPAFSLTDIDKLLKVNLIKECFAEEISCHSDYSENLLIIQLLNGENAKRAIQSDISSNEKISHQIPSKKLFKAQSISDDSWLSQIDISQKPD